MYWKYVLWSVKTKTRVLWPQRCCLCLEKEGRSVQPNKHRPHSETGGGCIMLLGCFSVPETENLIKVESIMKKEGYVKFLNKLHAVSS